MLGYEDWLTIFISIVQGWMNFSLLGTDADNTTLSGTLYINGVANQTNSSMANNTAWITNITMAYGNYNATLQVCDENLPISCTNSSITSFTLLSPCANLTTPGQVFSLSSIASISGITCFNVTAANVTIECNGLQIIGDNTSNTYGVVSTAYNTTIKDCSISNFGEGVKLTSASNSSIINSNVSCTNSNGGAGIRIASSDDVKITNSNSDAQDNEAIIFSASNRAILNNTFARYPHGIAIDFLSSSNNPILWNVTANSTNPPTAAMSFTGIQNAQIINSLVYTDMGEGLSVKAAGSNNFTIMGSTFFAVEGVPFNFSANNSLISHNTFQTLSHNLSAFPLPNDSAQFYSARNTNIYNNTFISLYGTALNLTQNTGDLDTVASVINNTFFASYWVSITGTLIQDSDFNTTTMGNSYIHANGSGSWNYTSWIDTNGDGFADAGSPLPVNRTNFAQWLGPDYDAHPWMGLISGNLQPNITSISISPNFSLSSQTIECRMRAIDDKTNQMNVSFEWYLNGTNQTALAGTTLNYANNSNSIIANLTMNASTIGNWSCRARVFDGSLYSDWNVSNNVTVIQDERLYICNLLAPNIAAEYSFFDSQSLAPVIATFNPQFTQGFNNGYVTTYTVPTIGATAIYCSNSTNTNWNVTEIAAATNYVTLQQIRYNQVYPPSGVNIYSLYLQPIQGGGGNGSNFTTGTTGPQPITLIVLDRNFAPQANFFINISVRNAQTQTLLPLMTLRTNQIGQAVAVLQALTVPYTFYISDSNGVLQATYSDLALCTSTPIGQPCTQTFYIGNITNMQYLTTLSGSGICQFDSSTFILTCPASGLQGLVSLNLTLQNMTNYNGEIILQNSTFVAPGATSGTLALTIPNLTGVYYFVFSAQIINVSSGQSYQQQLDDNFILVNQVSNRYSNDGWLLGFLLIITFAFVGFTIGPSVGIFLIMVAILLGVLMELFSLSPYTITALVVLFIVLIVRIAGTRRE